MSNKRITTIELFKEDMKFVAGHYTIFSANRRERLHGHTFNVHATIRAEVDDNGLSFDYHLYKDKIRQLCRTLNEYFLIAGHSPYQRIEQQNNQIQIHFADEVIPFLSKDVKILPISNTTVEELSYWFLCQLTADPKQLSQQGVQAICIKVYSGPGQCGSAQWQND